VLDAQEHIHLVNTAIKGVGYDFFWPPNQPRDWDFQTLVGRSRGGCRAGSQDPSGYPAQGDPWSRWMDEYYGGLKITAASNIVFSNVRSRVSVAPSFSRVNLAVDCLWNARDVAAAAALLLARTQGLLDPWSSGGVLRNLSSSVVTLILPNGAHHLVRCLVIGVVQTSGY
jgi:hypothetical protein